MQALLTNLISIFHNSLSKKTLFLYEKHSPLKLSNLHIKSFDSWISAGMTLFSIILTSLQYSALLTDRLHQWIFLRWAFSCLLKEQFTFILLKSSLPVLGNWLHSILPIAPLLLFLGCYFYSFNSSSQPTYSYNYVLTNSKIFVISKLVSIFKTATCLKSSKNYRGYCFLAFNTT